MQKKGVEGPVAAARERERVSLKMAQIFVADVYQ